ncbi:MAG TPA: extracellular solute-binding protein [Acetobacteraceae bacterium]|nr:extracellular solute-binding protein [Acetobacteraceae bacterium]
MQKLSRRGVLAGAAVVVTAPGAARSAQVAPITIAINQSPWFDGFRKLVDTYVSETGNKVSMDVNSFEGLLQKSRDSVRAKDGAYDLLPLNGSFFVEFYYGGFMMPLQEIDASFKLDPNVFTFDDTVYFDPATRTMNAKTGKLMTVPINPNVPMLYYRTDLYEKAGLKVPETFAELLANAKKLNDPPKIYGIVQRGARGSTDVSYDFFPYFLGFGADMFRDPKGGDFTVTVNSDKGRAALDYYLTLEHDAGHPNTGGLGQAQVIQNVVTGKAAHAIMVIAAWAQMDDKTKSLVPGKIGYAVPPHAPGFHPGLPIGHWLAGIPRNVPRERQAAALAFLNWFQSFDAQMKYTLAGAPPVRGDVLRTEVPNRPELRWMKPLADALPYGRVMWTVPEGGELTAVLDLRLNQAVTGELTAATALNTIAKEFEAIMQKGGYKTGRLPDLG